MLAEAPNSSRSVKATTLVLTVAAHLIGCESINDKAEYIAHDPESEVLAKILTKELNRCYQKVLSDPVSLPHNCSVEEAALTCYRNGNSIYYEVKNGLVSLQIYRGIKNSKDRDLISLVDQKSDGFLDYIYSCQEYSLPGLNVNKTYIKGYIPSVPEHLEHHVSTEFGHYILKLQKPDLYEEELGGDYKQAQEYYQNQLRYLLNQACPQTD